MTNETDREDAFNRALRRALDPEPGVANRVVQAALASKTQKRAAGSRRLVFAAAALLLVSFLAATWKGYRGRSDPSPSESAGAEARLIIANHGSVLALRGPNGQLSLRGGFDGPSSAIGELVILKGDLHERH